MKFFRSEDGNAMIELAFILPVMLLLVLGAFDYGFIMEQRLRLQEACAAGTAYASQPGHYVDLSGAQSAATTASVNMSGMTVTASSYYTCSPGSSHVTSSTVCSGNTIPMQWMEVDATVTPTLHIQFPGLPTSQQLNATSVRRVN